MLRRHRQIRMQVQQMLDACLFAAAFWLSYEIRATPAIYEYFRLDPFQYATEYFWFYLILVPFAPLILEAQGFYDRPILGPRRAALWPLFKGCLFTTVTLIIVLYFLNFYIARWVVIWFGFISFVLVALKEEIFRIVYRSNLSQKQYRRRLLIVGSTAETARLAEDFQRRKEYNTDVVDRKSVV